MFFSCAICGKQHLATERYTKNQRITEEERAKLKAEYYKAYDLWLQNQTPGGSFEKKLEKTENSYFGSLPGADVWLVPNALMTDRKNGKNFSRCTDGCK